MLHSVHRTRLQLTACARLYHQEVISRLGFLSVFSPHFPDGYYRLDLARSDERRIAEMLVKLAVRRSHAWQSLLPLTFVMQVVEPGENWVDETYLDRPFELPMTWVEQVPHKVRRRQR